MNRRQGFDPEANRSLGYGEGTCWWRNNHLINNPRYLEEAEQLADRIAILHGGKIITTGTLTELKEMFPPTKVEYRRSSQHWKKYSLRLLAKRRRCKMKSKTGYYLGA